MTERRLRAAQAAAPSSPLLPYGHQLIDDDDIAAVVDVLRGDFLTGGPATAKFEEALAECTGARFAAAVSSGTAALHLAARAIGIGPGDWVVVPAVTFLATANAVRLAGGEVQLADVDADSGLMREENVEAALRMVPGTARAVFPVHLNGQCADVPAIARLARSRGLRVVDDACHAIGTTYARHGDEAAQIGGCKDCDATVFSFHPVKTVTSGEGGAVTTNDETLHRAIARDRSHGISRNPDEFENLDLAFAAGGGANPWYYEMAEVGLNYRSSDIHSALGRAQLAKIGGFVRRRRELVDRYRQLLAPLAPTVSPIGQLPGCEAAWHLFVVLIDFPSLQIDRAGLMNRLLQHRVGSQVHYLPLHLQPYYRKRYGQLDLPGAERYYQRALSLPLFPGMELSDVDYVVQALADSLSAG